MNLIQRLFCLALLAAALVCAPGANAQDATLDPAATAAPPATTAAVEEGPVAVPEPSEKAMDYYRSGIRVWLGGLLIDFALPLLILFTGLSAWLQRQAARAGGGWVVTLALYWVAFVVLSALLTLPWEYYTGFVRQHAFGLSNQTLTKFFQDWGIGLALNALIVPLFLWIPFLLLRKAPRYWWLVTGILVFPLVLLQMLVYPIWIDPLFNDFGPMKDKALEAKILAIADRANIEGSDVFEVAKSEDTKAVNAYVTGFFSSKRIVLWDTLLAKLNEREALFVMAHEMGHYVLGHVLQMIALVTVLMIAALYAVHRISGWFIARFRARLGFDSLAEPAAIPLILFLVGVVSFVVSPALLAFSRHNEHEADRFALEITRDNFAGATAFVKLQQENLGNPRPDWYVKLWRGSHPSLGERIDFCNCYKPWNEGQPGRYAHLFKAESSTP